MVIVIPLVSTVTFLLSHWVTSSFVDPSDGSRRAPARHRAGVSQRERCDDQLGDLDGVERGALAQVVVARRTARGRGRRRRPGPAGSGRRTTGPCRPPAAGVGMSVSSTPGAPAEQPRAARSAGQRPLELGVDRQRVTGEDRHPHADARDPAGRGCRGSCGTRCGASAPRRSPRARRRRSSRPAAARCRRWCAAYFTGSGNATASPS